MMLALSVGLVCGMHASPMHYGRAPVHTASAPRLSPTHALHRVRETIQSNDESLPGGATLASIASGVATVGIREKYAGKILRARVPVASAAQAGTPGGSGATKLTFSPSAKGALSLSAIIVVDTILKRFFVARAISFPSSLAGSMILFAALCLLKTSVPTVADKIFDAAQPGCAIINKWLPLFFVPNLILLPLVLKLGASEAARLAILLLGGAVVSLPLCAFAALGASGLSSASAPMPAPSAPAPPAGPAPKAFPDSLLRLLATSTSACAIISTAAFRSASPLAAPFRDAFLLGATGTGFVAGATLVPKAVQKVVHPLITCTAFTHLASFAFASAAALPYKAVVRSYLVPGGAPLAAPGNALLAMLGPATLSFGFSMYEKRTLLMASLPAVGGAITAASFGGLFGSAFLARVLGLSDALTRACLPRQVTAPLAIAISGLVGADPGIACTVVVLTGLMVANFGRAVLDALGVKDPVARGLAMGSAGHGIGTAATAVERAAFPFAAIAMVTNALVSTIICSIPMLRRALLNVAGVP